MSKPLQSEFEFYLRQQPELVQKYNGRFIVIVGQEVIGAWDSQPEAILEASKTHELGTFLVQKVESGPEGYTRVFHSRAAFA